jgi:hypothetical protein
LATPEELHQIHDSGQYRICLQQIGWVLRAANTTYDRYDLLLLRGDCLLHLEDPASAQLAYAAAAQSPAAKQAHEGRAMAFLLRRSQISTAGYEASGTRNMKFMMNGALTVGTRDGATIQMAQEAGEENFFLFGLSADQVAASAAWYSPWWHYHNEPETRAALDLIFSNHFSRNEPAIFETIRETLLDGGDRYMHLADLSSYLDASQTRAGMVTCGGLCPGLNNIIRSLFGELRHAYGVKEVLGFSGGYRGLDPASGEEPLQLTPEFVNDIHRRGGTVLGPSRRMVDQSAAVENLARLGVNMLFTVGGDGTQRGGNELFQLARQRGQTLAVVGIPKTIDNDVALVARTFGFLTAVQEAWLVLDRAHAEARSVQNGIALVKVMGRHAGFIAAGATVAS